MFGAIAPKETRALVEAATREAEKSWSGLRLSEKQRTAKLEKLQGDLRRLEAVAELDRREKERANADIVMPRSTADPAIWSLTTDELRQMAR